MSPTLRRTALACILLGLLVACGTESTRTFRLGTVELVDEAGLVTAAVAIDPPAVDAYRDAPVVVNPDGRLDRAVLLWRGNSCAPSTRVTLSGNALTLAIEQAAANDGCAGTFVLHAIQMDLNRVIDVSSIEVEVDGVAG
jgi:hypothetical protein